MAIIVLERRRQPGLRGLMDADVGAGAELPKGMEDISASPGAEAVQAGTVGTMSPDFRKLLHEKGGVTSRMKAAKAVEREARTVTTDAGLTRTLVEEADRRAAVVADTEVLEVQVERKWLPYTIAVGGFLVGLLLARFLVR